MKLFVVFCGFLVAGIQASYVTLPPIQNEKANNCAYACIEESGVTTEALKESRKGNFFDDEGLKKFTHCFFQKADIVTCDGQLNIDVALAKLPVGVDKVLAKEILEGCKSKTGKDSTDKVYEMFKCYFSQTPQADYVSYNSRAIAKIARKLFFNR